MKKICLLLSCILLPIALYSATQSVGIDQLIQNVVKTDTNQTISGNKTFTSSPTVLGNMQISHDLFLQNQLNAQFIRGITSGTIADISLDQYGLAIGNNGTQIHSFSYTGSYIGNYILCEAGTPRWTIRAIAGGGASILIDGDIEISTYSSKPKPLVTFRGNLETTYGVKAASITVPEIWNVTSIQFADGSVSTTTVGGGDMTKATYDTDDDAIVDNSEKLNNQLPSQYATVDSTNNTVNKAVFIDSMTKVDANFTAKSVFIDSMTRTDSGINSRTLQSVFVDSMTKTDAGINSRTLQSVFIDSMTRIDANFISSMAIVDNNMSARTLNSVFIDSMTKTDAGINSRALQSVFISSMDTLGSQVLYKTGGTMTGETIMSISTTSASPGTRFASVLVCSNGAITLPVNNTAVLDLGCSSIKSFVFSCVGDYVANIHIQSITGGAITMHNTNASDTVDIYYQAIVVK